MDLLEALSEPHPGKAPSKSIMGRKRPREPRFDDEDEDEQDEGSANEDYPDLEAYFNTFPHVTTEQRIKIARLFANYKSATMRSETLPPRNKRTSK
jgi:hypothetical protein